MRSGDKNPEKILADFSSDKLREINKTITELDDTCREFAFRYQSHYNSPFVHLKIVIKDILGERALNE